MGGLWLGGLAMQQGSAQGGSSRPAAGTAGLQRRVRELEHHIGRLTLLNQALWEVLREKVGLTDEQLRAKIHEVDLRDGVEDGRMTETGLVCPSCRRVSSSKHWKCLYCGQEFERPVMG